MKSTLPLIVFLAFAGCSKKEAASPSVSTARSAEAKPAPDDGGQAAPPEPARPSSARAAAPAAPAPAPPGEGPIDGTVHPFMTQQLQIFIQQNGRMPKDFREFASARMDSVPRLPPGLKYAIDSSTAEVKIVRQ